jgi:hypothetical protein
LDSLGTSLPSWNDAAVNAHSDKPAQTRPLEFNSFSLQSASAAGDARVHEAEIKLLNS